MVYLNVFVQIWRVSHIDRGFSFSYLGALLSCFLSSLCERLGLFLNGPKGPNFLINSCLTSGVEHKWDNFLLFPPFEAPVRSRIKNGPSSEIKTCEPLLVAAHGTWVPVIPYLKENWTGRWVSQVIVPSVVLTLWFCRSVLDGVNYRYRAVLLRTNVVLR